MIKGIFLHKNQVDSIEIAGPTPLSSINMGQVNLKIKTQDKEYADIVFSGDELIEAMEKMGYRLKKFKGNIDASYYLRWKKLISSKTLK